MSNEIWKNNNLLKKIFEEKNHKIFINGIFVSDEGVLDPTGEWLCKKYKQFNKTYFNNNLSYLTPNDFEIIDSNKNAAFTDQDIYFNNLGEKIILFGKPKIYFSRFYQRTEKECCEILLHEMIHIYVIEIARLVEPNLGHGNQFINKLNEINSYGWDIPILGVRKLDKKIYKEIENKLKASYLIAIANGENKYQVCIISSNYIADLRYMPNTRMFLINNTKNLTNISYINDIQELYKDMLTGDIMLNTMTKSDIEKFIKNGDITEILTDGTLKESFNHPIFVNKDFPGTIIEELPNGLIKAHLRFVD